MHIPIRKEDNDMDMVRNDKSELKPSVVWLAVCESSKSAKISSCCVCVEWNVTINELNQIQTQIQIRITPSWWALQFHSAMDEPIRNSAYSSIQSQSTDQLTLRALKHT